MPLFADLLEQFISIHFRHHDVEYDEINMLCLQNLQRLQIVTRQKLVLACIRQRILHKQRVLPLSSSYDQNAKHSALHLSFMD